MASACCRKLAVRSEGIDINGGLESGSDESPELIERQVNGFQVRGQAALGTQAVERLPWFVPGDEEQHGLAHKAPLAELVREVEQPLRLIRFPFLVEHIDDEHERLRPW